MDPLSISVSVVTLLSAANSIAGGINKLASLSRAPASLLALSNELSDLRLVLAESEAVLSDHAMRYEKIEAASSGRSLSQSIERAKRHLEELEEVEKRLSTSSGGIDRLAWLWEQDNIRKIQKDLRTVRLDIVAVLGLVSSYVGPLSTFGKKKANPSCSKQKCYFQDRNATSRHTVSCYRKQCCHRRFH
jgi:hypothetical protein